MKKIISFVMACILLLCLCACGSEPTLVGNDSNTGTTAPKEEEKVFKLGDTVELNDIVVHFKDVIESKGEKFAKPEDGNIFVLCEFEITNNASEELSISSMLSFEAYCDDYACEYSLSALMAKGNKDQLDGSVAAGKKMKGVIGYEIPSDWKELEIQFTPDILSSDKIVFTAANS